jgi:hypothetical protein
MTPCSHPAALRFLRLAVPQHSLVVFAPRQTSALPRPGVGNPVSPAGNSLSSEQGSPKFLGNHNCPFVMFQSDAGRTVYTRPYGATAWPLVIEGQRLPRKVFRRSIALLSDSLSTRRSAGYPNTTQDSLPVAGQALLDRLASSIASDGVISTARKSDRRDETGFLDVHTGCMNPSLLAR